MYARQERWESERIVVEGSGEASAQNAAEEALLRAEVARLAAADVVLVPYPVLSREVSMPRAAAACWSHCVRCWRHHSLP